MYFSESFWSCTNAFSTILAYHNIMAYLIDNTKLNFCISIYNKTVKNHIPIPI